MGKGKSKWEREPAKIKEDNQFCIGKRFHGEVDYHFSDLAFRDVVRGLVTVHSTGRSGKLHLRE